MNVAGLQARLAAAGFDPGPLDGLWGPRTLAALMALAAGRASAGIPALAAALAAAFAQAEVTGRLRVCHALAQGCVETGGWRWLTELGGPGWCARYDGRADLGNVRAGDGYRFRGRGIVQITGRDNYRRYGERLGLDLLAAPERAAEPEVAARIFCAYWSDHGLNAFADADDSRAISRAINRGNPRARLPANHEAERLALASKLKGVWPA